MRVAPVCLTGAMVAALACSRDDVRNFPSPGPSPGPAHGAPEDVLPFSTVTAPQLRALARATGARAVLVNAWATWCGSCEHELPMLQAVADHLAARGLRVLLVSVDEPADVASVRAFLGDKGIRLTSYLAARPLGAFKAGMNPAWPGMLPASFLLDAKGELRYFWGGEAFEGELTPVIDALLEGKPIEGQADLPVAPSEAPRAP